MTLEQAIEKAEREETLVGPSYCAECKDRVGFGSHVDLVVEREEETLGGLVKVVVVERFCLSCAPMYSEMV